MSIGSSNVTLLALSGDAFAGQVVMHVNRPAFRRPDHCVGHIGAACFARHHSSVVAHSERNRLVLFQVASGLAEPDRSQVADSSIPGRINVRSAPMLGGCVDGGPLAYNDGSVLVRSRRYAGPAEREEQMELIDKSTITTRRDLAPRIFVAAYHDLPDTLRAALGIPSIGSGRPPGPPPSGRQSFPPIQIAAISAGVDREYCR